MRLQALLILSSLYLFPGEFKSATSPHPPIISSGTVVGTIITACDNVTFHTPPGDPYPTSSKKHSWLIDSHTPCLSDPDAALVYCRKIYNDGYSELLVDHVVADPFKIMPNILPWFPKNVSSAIRVYLCLGPISPNLINTQLLDDVTTMIPLEPPSTPAPHHRLPTLIDVHRTYFAEQFRHLWNQTHTNVSRIVDQLVRQSKGLSKLYSSDPQTMQYAVSEMLKEAHKRLHHIWTTEESEWTRLEQQQHSDLASQLGSDEWAGENMFAFALQESHVNLSRIQDALSVLLSRLADSVSEEVRHLRSVQGRQPWMLRLNFSTNWQPEIANSATDLDQVHRVLLKYVRVATLAINTFHEIVNQNIQAFPDPDPLRYKPTLVASYNRLQANLLDAQRWLNKAKSTLLRELKHHTNVLLNHFNTSLHSDSALPDWIESKHHAELAYIDLLATQMLSPYMNKVDLPIGSNDSTVLWTPEGLKEGLHFSQITPEDVGWQRDKLIIFITIGLCCISLASSLLFCFIRTHYLSDSSRLLSIMSRGGHKVKHLLGKSKPHWITVSSRIIVADPDQFVTDQSPSGNLVRSPFTESKIHQYMNPMCAPQRV